MRHDNVVPQAAAVRSVADTIPTRLTHPAGLSALPLRHASMRATAGRRIAYNRPSRLL